MDFFIINLNETALNQMFFLRLTIREGDDLAECSRDDSSSLFALGWTHHGVGFSTTGLPVGEDGAIVALDDTVDKGESSLFVDIALKGVGAEHMVESERLGCLLFITFEKINLIRLGINLHNGLTI